MLGDQRDRARGRRGVATSFERYPNTIRSRRSLSQAKTLDQVLTAGNTVNRQPFTGLIPVRTDSSVVIGIALGN